MDKKKLADENQEGHTNFPKVSENIARICPCGLKRRLAIESLKLYKVFNNFGFSLLFVMSWSPLYKLTIPDEFLDI